MLYKKSGSIMKHLIALSTLLFAPLANAGTVLQYDAPTVRTDGTAITGDLTYRIYKNDALVTETDALTYTFPDNSPVAGTLCVSAVETVDNHSAESAKICADVLAKPDAPGRFIIIQY
jgi:hypothetical protein